MVHGSSPVPFFGDELRPELVAGTARGSSSFRVEGLGLLFRV